LRIVGDGSLDCAPHVLSRPEKPVCRHEPAEGLVWPLEVVSVNEEPKSLLAVREI
jgi:hypothetical protein